MTADTATASGFEGFGLSEALLSTLGELGYEEPTPIQRATIPALLAGRDVLGQAATGTGKTAAFALPLLSRIAPGSCKPFQTSALIIVPTRELAMQVAEAVHSYGRRLGVTVLPVYGGQDLFQQLRRLKKGVDVVVATPGRAVDHLNRKTLKLDRVKLVVLDEADEMLDMGFADDLDAVLAHLPEERQTALFSATLPPRIAAIAERHLKDPERVRIGAEKLAGALPKIRQTAYVVPREQKTIALGRLLDVEAPESAIVFCRTRVEVDGLTEALNGHGYDAAALHGGMSQEQRDRVLKRFKAHQLQLLVATDVAARGLHVEKLSHVFNYDVPTDTDTWVHRIGRTGRAGREGVAITLLESRELRHLKNVERVTKQRIPLGRLPTVTDLRERRLALTRATVEEALRAAAFEPYAAVVTQLAGEHDLAAVAAAAVQRLHEALNPQREGEEELEAHEPPAREERRGGKGGWQERGPRAGAGERHAPRRHAEEEAPRRGPKRPYDADARERRHAEEEAPRRGPKRPHDADAREQRPHAEEAAPHRGPKRPYDAEAREQRRHEGPPHAEGEVKRGHAEHGEELPKASAPRGEAKRNHRAEAPSDEAEGGHRAEHGEELPKASAPRGEAKRNHRAEAPSDEAERGHRAEHGEELPKASAPRGEAKRNHRAEAPSDEAGRGHRAEHGEELPRSSAPRGEAKRNHRAEAPSDELPKASAPRGEAGRAYPGTPRAAPKVHREAQQPWRERAERSERPLRGPQGALTSLFIGMGSRAGVRPADLVGAIANEAGISSKEIGAIQIADEHSFVEVPARHAEAIIKALRQSTIRGRKPRVDRNRARR